MLTPILFRGGMYGDLILAMIDPTATIKTNYWQKEYVHSTAGGNYIKYTRTYMKKFFLYSDQQKHRYYKAFEKVKKKVGIATHDTDFSMAHHQQNTIQVVCSDLELMPNFAQRFASLHRPKVIKEAGEMIKAGDDFITDYKKSLIQWQEVFNFPNRLDIKNIFQKEKFIQDLQQCLSNMDVTYASQVYDNHIKKK